MKRSTLDLGADAVLPLPPIMAGRPKIRARREALGLPVAPRSVTPIEPPPRPPLYDYDEAAAIAFYSPETIRRFCDNGVLVRGRDFIVREYRRGILRRIVRLITPAGIDTLIARQSRAIPRHHHGNARTHVAAQEPAPPTPQP